ncbi:quinone oxidoreductase family protein [Pelagibacterium montanilacus]|uniref:quinone oxidoreductase family protein n=1 Tax=Pelagibacterium montanilacus TaxID=2185280 RepID=UPI0019D13AB3|nr:quinone oxidoreductase [Pelagibacterium montanilacus]
MKAQAIQIDQPGAADVMTLREIDVPAPGQGEVQVRQVVCGVNYLDIYQRSGSYSNPMPMGMGNEAAGTVEAVGPDVVGVSIGDRVVYQGGSAGAYASLRNVLSNRVVHIPEGVSEQDAAATLLKGMTVEYLLDRCVRLEKGDMALMYAAGGGVGLLAGQWARARGFRLIGVASGADKCELARASGYHAVIDRSSETIVERIKELTDGKGLPVVFDSIGKATFETTLDCLAPRGYFVSFGATSGPPPAVAASELQKRGSLYFTRPTLVTYCGTPELYAASASKVMALLESGDLKPHIGQRYPLAQAAQAHLDLEGGKTTGATLLTI